MRGVRGKLGLAIIGLAMLAACGSKDPKLMNMRSDGGPDEFAIMPTKPLQAPDSYTELPEPTPGGTNLTDPTPEADAVAALGGRTSGGGISAADAALVNQASRFGVTSDIRNVLAAEDLEWRRDHDGRLLERVFKVNVYYKAYAAMSLDQYAELARLRALGIWTPSAPPEGITVE